MRVNFTNNYTLNFKSDIETKVFSDVRDISGIKCAKCSRKMMSKPERDKFYSKITTYDDELVPTQELVMNLANLKKKFPDMPKYYSDFIGFAVEYTKKYPFDTLTEIFQKPEIVEYHKRAAANSTLKFKKNLSNIAENIEKLSKKLPKNQKEEIKNLNAQMLKYVKAPKGRSVLTKYVDIFEQYSNFINSISDKKLAQKIRNELNKLPQDYYLDGHHYVLRLQSDEITDKKIMHILQYNLKHGAQVDLNEIQNNVKVKKTSDENIVHNIISSISSTFEHIIPAQIGGAKEKNNGIFLCSNCNTERQTISYATMAELFQDFGKNINIQVQQLTNLIKQGKLPEYSEENSLVALKHTLKSASDGKLSIDVDDYMQFKKQFIDKNLTVIQEQQEKQDKILENTNTKLDLLQNKFERIQEKITELKELQGKIFGKIKAEKGLQKKLLSEQKNLNEMFIKEKIAKETILQLIEEDELK